jgi:hypothetical protein
MVKWMQWNIIFIGNVEMIKKFSNLLIGSLLIGSLIGCGAGGSSTIDVKINSLSVIVPDPGCQNLTTGGTCTIRVSYTSNTVSQLGISTLTSPFTLGQNPNPCVTPSATPQLCTLTVTYNVGAGNKNQTLTITLGDKVVPVAISGQ